MLSRCQFESPTKTWPAAWINLDQSLDPEPAKHNSENEERLTHRRWSRYLGIVLTLATSTSYSDLSNQGTEAAKIVTCDSVVPSCI